ncbi:hypothetical protein Tco_0698774 [Tanacetum coccineum]
MDDVSFSEVCVSLYNIEPKRKDKQISSSGDAKALPVRVRSLKKGTDKGWFEVRAKEWVIKIIFGILVVMKVIREINNMYPYKGRTIVGTVAPVTDGDRNSEVVKLWHMRLGHA